jgi:type I restriction enzyme M protein
MNSENITQKLWNYCHVLLADGMHFSDYVGQLTYLLFLRMSDERTQASYNQASIVPEQWGWQGREGVRPILQ